jgi:hypothetical protein
MSTPDETFADLIKDAKSVRRKRSLEALHTTCRLLIERNVADLSYKSIVTLGKDRRLPVPSEKTIRNGTGLHYRELIHSWRIAHRPSSRPASNSEHIWIEQIKDPVVRMSVALLAKELRLQGKRSSKIQSSFWHDCNH